MNARPRLLVLTSTWPRWPDDTDPPFVFELCRRLTAEFAVTVLAPHAAGLAREETMDGITVIRFRYAPDALETLAYEGGMSMRLRRRPLRLFWLPFFIISQTVAIRKMLKETDIIHAHWLIPQGLTLRLALWGHCKRPPILMTAHGGDLYGLQHPLFTHLKSWIVGGINAFTVVSAAMVEHLKDLGTQGKRIEIAAMGVDLSTRFTPGQSPRDPRRLIFVGRLVPKKGLDTLLQALAILRHAGLDLSLDIIGDGPMRESWMGLANDLELQDAVHFHGAKPNTELPAWYRLAGMAVFPFKVASDGDQEGFGLVMAEAMGCGCPVLVGDLPVTRDLIVHGKTGWHFKSGDAEDLAAQLKRWTTTDAEHTHVARAALRFAKARYDWSVVAQTYARLILETKRHHNG